MRRQPRRSLFPARAHVPRIHLSRFFAVFSLLGLLLSLASPIASTVAARADVVPTEQTEELPLDQPTEPVAEPTMAIEEEPTETVEVTPTATVENQLVGSVNINYWQCPDGTNPTTTPLGQLESDCTEKTNGVRFTINAPGGFTDNQETGFYDDGAIGFSEVPTGAISFGQTQPQAPILVTCKGIVSHGGPETGDMMLPVSNGKVTWNLLDDEIVFCNWYAGAQGAMPTVDPSATPENELIGSISLNYWQCPDGTDPATVPVDQLETTCTEKTNGINFTVSASGGYTDSQMTGFYDDGAIGFSGIPTGPITFGQVPAADTAVVLCNGIVSHGGPETGIQNLPVTGGMVNWNLLDDEIVFCNWYAGGVSGADVPTVTPAMGTPENELIGSVNISYWECPTGTDLSTLPDDQFETTCTDTANNILFQLAAPGGYTDSQQTGYYDDGVIGFSGIPTGAITFGQRPVPAAATVFCNGIVSHGGPETGIMKLPVTNGDVSWNLLDDEIVYCNWYVTEIPAGMGTVYINKHACAETFTLPDPMNPYDLAANCHEDPGTVNFTVTSGSFSASGTTSTAPNNGWQVDDVPSGAVTMSESIPTGYSQPVVYCKGDGPQDEPSLEVPYSLQDVLNGTVTWNLLPEQTAFCDWYNIPLTYGTVYVNKHACPATFTLPDPMNPYDLAANCHEDPGTVSFNVTSGSFSASGTTSTAPNNGWQVDDVPTGAVTVTESIPTGYSQPVVYCKGDSLTDDPTIEVPYALQSVSGGAVTWNLLPEQTMFCDWFNIPTPTTATIWINKYACENDPSAYMTGGVPDFTKFDTYCVNPLPGVEFSAYSGGAVASSGTTTNTNPLALADVPTGGVTLAETVPDGYGQPYVFCGPSNDLYMVSMSAIDLQLMGDLTCNWYNIPTGTADVTIYKWTCEPGYDYTLPGADPSVDCTEATDGVTFNLDQEAPGTYTSQTNTGDSIPGAVHWGGIPIGDYVVTETVPDGIESVFVLDCTGGYSGSIHPVPLSLGNVLSLTAGSGDDIVCNWYNVPTPDPDRGSLTIYAYICSTTTFVSDINCEIDETGRAYNVTSYVSQNQPGTTLAFAQLEMDGTTNAIGALSFANLAIGPYLVEEVGKDPCAIGATYKTPDGDTVDALDANGLALVEPNTDTAVKVYMCGAKPASGGGSGQLPNSGKVPTKYPNTGAQSDQVIEPDGGHGEEGTPEADVCADTGTPVPTPTEDPEADEASGTPEALVCGEVPVAISIEAIDLEATVEVLETVNGEMQDPTTPDQASWYKETARLGAPGNTVMAGHLNYWNVPEGVFFKLGTLEKGDRIEVTGKNGEIWVYEVEWVKQVDATQPPTEEILGETDEPSLTLLTCGGPWNSATSEYTERTVVRAVLVTPEEDDN